MSRPCGDCKKNVTPKQNPGISCVVCKKFYHFACVKLSKEKIDSIEKNKLSWTCKKCNRSSTIIPADTDSASPTLTATPIETAFQNFLAEFVIFKHSVEDRLTKIEAHCANKHHEVGSLKTSLKSVELKARELEQFSVESFLEIQGLPENDLLDPDTLAQTVAQEIDCPIDNREISCAVSRSGTKPVLVIKFSSATTRLAFLKAGKRFNREKRKLELNNQKHKIFVNEQLTSDQKKLLYNSKRFARENNYKFAWFCNGQTHLKKTDDAQPIIVRTQTQLENLAQNEVINLLPEREGDPLENQRTPAGNQEQ